MDNTDWKYWLVTWHREGYPQSVKTERIDQHPADALADMMPHRYVLLSAVPISRTQYQKLMGTYQ